MHNTDLLLASSLQPDVVLGKEIFDVDYCIVMTHVCHLRNHCHHVIL